MMKKELTVQECVERFEKYGDTVEINGGKVTYLEGEK